MKDFDATSHEKESFKIMKNFEAAICMIGMTGMMVIVTAQVVCRLVGSPIGWAEEVARMLTIFVTFGGSSYAFYQGAHVGVTLLVDRLPANSHKAMRIIGQLIIIAFFLCMLYFASNVAIQQIGRKSVAAQIPMIVPYAMLPIGAFMVLIRVVQETVSIIKTPAKEKGKEEK